MSDVAERSRSQRTEVFLSPREATEGLSERSCWGKVKSEVRTCLAEGEVERARRGEWGNSLERLSCEGKEKGFSWSL